MVKYIHGLSAMENKSIGIKHEDTTEIGQKVDVACQQHQNDLEVWSKIVACV